MNDVDQLLALPTGGLVLLGLLLVAQIVLLVVGVLAWNRTPEDRMPAPGKWPWLAVVCLISLVGPVAFLVARRSTRPPRPAEASGPTPAAGRPSPDRTVDLLYGLPEDQAK